MAGLQERPCSRCGFIMGPFDTSCPRCSRLAQVPCSQCHQQGVIGNCTRCHQPVCEACASREQEELLCRSCLALATGASHYVHQPAPSAPEPHAYRLPATGLDRGLGSSFSRALIFIREAVAMAFRDIDLMLPSALSLLVTGGMVAGLYFILRANGVDIWDEGSTKRFVGQHPIPLIAVALVSAFVHYFTVGATVSLVASHLRGEDARIGLALRDAARHSGAIAALAVVSTLVAALSSALRKRGHGLAGEATQHLWTVASYLLIPVIMLEHTSFSAATGRAWALHSKNLIGIAVGEIGVEIVSRVGFFVLTLVFVVGIVLAAMNNVLALSAGLAIAFVAMMLFAAFMMYLRTAYYTCLYLWAAERETAGEQVPAPAPLARALGY